MGSWGIRAHDSDQGLDLLAVADERYLRGMKYKTFHVKHITELLETVTNSVLIPKAQEPKTNKTHAYCTL